MLMIEGFMKTRADYLNLPNLEMLVDYLNIFPIVSQFLKSIRAETVFFSDVFYSLACNRHCEIYISYSIINKLKQMRTRSIRIFVNF